MQTKRVFIELKYKGSQYHGWQIQENAHSVQGTLNQALSRLFGLQIETLGSGRTDTGVHASQQFCHLDVPIKFENGDLCYKLNAMLPSDISVSGIYDVAPNAHARFDATHRSYYYIISNAKNPFEHGLVYVFPKDLDIVAMNESCKMLIGTKDFESFSRTKTSVNNFICEIFHAYWEEKGNNYIFHISANRFLRGMVRAIVGTLLEIGTQKRNPDHMNQVLKARNRSFAGRAVPPEGLYLSEVSYPRDIFL